METTLPSTHPVYSKESVFHLIEEFLLGRQQRNIPRMIQSFHPKIEFRGIDPTKPTCGITSFEGAMGLLLKETTDFGFKIKKLIWDESLSTGAVTIEQQYDNPTEKKRYRLWEVAMFAVEDGLIIHYTSAKHVLGVWDL